jgi:RimJ/RimL family protein N-acetyltransferase
VRIELPIETARLVIRPLELEDAAMAGLQWEQIDGGRELDLGCVVAADAQQRGYGTEASEAVLDAGFAAGFERITAMTGPDNAPALRVLEKLGTRDGETDFEGRRYALFAKSSAG